VQNDVLPVRPRGKPRLQPAELIPAIVVGQPGPVITFYAAVLICDDRARGVFAPAAGAPAPSIAFRAFFHTRCVTAVATTVVAARELASVTQCFVKVKNRGKASCLPVRSQHERKLEAYATDARYPPKLGQSSRYNPAALVLTQERCHEKIQLLQFGGVHRGSRRCGISSLPSDFGCRSDQDKFPVCQAISRWALAHGFFDDGQP
jgi:hypothetical protein